MCVRVCVCVGGGGGGGECIINVYRMRALCILEPGSLCEPTKNS